MKEIVGWIVGNTQGGPHSFRKKEPKGWQYSDGVVTQSYHEAEITRLRAELAAKSKDAARWDWIMNNYYGGDLTRTQKVIGACFSREAMEASIDKDLGE